MWGYVSKVIDCIKELSTPKKLINLANVLALSEKDAKQLINEINQIEPNIVRVMENGDDYYISRDLDWLDEAMILHDLALVGIYDYQIKIFAVLGSTNTYLMQNVANMQNFTVVATEIQLQGRGRFDRIWHSKIAKGLTFSVLLFFDSDYNFALIPLIIAVAVNRVLNQFKIKNFLKWPNDVYSFEGVKIAGILVESGVLHRKRFVIIGIGINDDYGIKRDLFLSTLLIHIKKILEEYDSFGFSILSKEWLENCIHHNKSVAIYQNDRFVKSGINIGIADNGAIMIKSSNSEINEYINVSIRFEVEDK